jgi:exosortase A
MLLNPPPGVVADANLNAPPLARSTLILIVLALLAPFALYFGTVRSIVSIWNSSETFAHGYVILPISLWLIWRRRANFSVYPPRPYAPALMLLALLGAAWLAAQLGEVQVVSQYAFVAMLPVAALAVLGPRLAGSLTFPLLFLLFAVPFGEIFVGPLIEFTADFTVAAVQATGIPVLRSGTRFELPTGNWSVVEACSGVRYLISSITLGCLYAYLTYRSTARRVLFIGLSMVVPVIANGLRAYMIVMIGHLSGMELATGVDHIIYGWLFFGLVMFIMFWIGSYWREDTDTPAVAVAAGPGAQAGASFGKGGGMPAMAAGVVLAAALWPALALYGEHANQNPRPVALADVGVNLPQAPEFANWKPDYMKPDVTLHRVYQGTATPVALTLLYYRNQDREKSLISSINRLAGYKDAWHDVGSAMRSESFGGHQLSLRETILNKPGASIMVWSFMWIGGEYTSSNVVGKLWQARAKVLLRGDDGAAIMLSAPVEQNPEQARAALRRFLQEQGPALDRALVAERGR